MKIYFDRPGIAAIGPYLPGIIYDVEETEALRLIEAKGFKKAADETTPKRKPQSTEPKE